MIFNMSGSAAAGSGSGTGLNFRVVGGTSEPLNPVENTIWVNTDQEITNWTFSFEEPTNPFEGMVWICIGLSSPVMFNALKNNSIQVCPISAKQYVGGAWIDKTAKSRQNGAWSKFETALYIYNNGESTGYSLKCSGTMKQMSSGYTAASERVTMNNSNITVVTDGRAYDFTNIFVTDDYGEFIKVNLSKYTKIRIKGTLSWANKNTACVFRVMSEMGTICTANNVVSQSLTAAGTDVEIDTVVDISAVNSSCYLGFTFYNEVVNEVVMFKLTELWLE